MIKNCPDCDNDDIVKSIKLEVFTYGSKYSKGILPVVLSCKIPVWTCDMCFSAFTDNEAAEIKVLTVAEHLASKEKSK